MACCFIGLSFLEFVKNPPHTRFRQCAPPASRQKQRCQLRLQQTRNPALPECPAYVRKPSERAVATNHRGHRRPHPRDSCVLLQADPCMNKGSDARCRSSPFRFESRHIFNTTLPKGLPSIWYRSASAASSRANVRATTGFIAPDSSNVKIDAHAVPHISGGCAKSEKLFMLARFQMTSVTPIIASRPPE